MRCYLLSALFFVIVSLAPAEQTPWQWVNPLPQGNLLNNVWAVNQDTVVSVGENGTILRSTNGGQTWDVRHNVAGISEQLFAVQFVSDSTGWAVGEYGRILKTTNGGDSWFIQNIASTLDIYGVYFASPLIGWVVGSEGSIFKTTDAGFTWFAESSHTTATLFAIYFRTATLGWAVGTSGAIVQTTDGGTTWIAQTSSTNQTLYSISFTSGSTGYIAGSFGVILKTNNAGTNWIQQVSGTDQSLYGIQFSSALTGYALGSYGTIIKTTNGGSAWFSQTSPTLHDIYGLDFVSDLIGWCVGDFGTILETTNGGSTWTPLSNGVKNDFFAIHFPTITTGYAVGDVGSFAKTTNQGKNWISGNSGTFRPLYGVYFLDANTGWAVGDSATILKTTNAGISWVEENSHTDPTLYSIYFVNTSTGWAVGDFGTILKTINGGLTWLPQSSGVTTSFLRVKFASSTIGWAVGYGGIIVKTTDGGGTWVQQTSGTIRTLSALEIIDQNTAMIGADFGTVLTTGNGGTTWQIQSANTDASLYGISFFSPLVGWAVGDDGTVVRTNDGGVSWTAQYTPTIHTLFEVQVIKSGTGGGIFATGIGGTIISSGISQLPLRIWTGSFDTSWSNPGNWNPVGLPNKFDSVYIPLTTNNPSIRTSEQLIAIGALTIATGAKLTVGNGLAIMIVKGDITIFGSLIVEPTATTEILTGGSLATNVSGKFTPGNSTITFSGIGQMKGDFNRVILGDGASMQTVGNVTVKNSISLLSNFALRLADTLSILSPEPEAIDGDGIITAGTVKRAIKPGSTSLYRFESPVTYILFYPTGVTPNFMSMTTFPNTFPPGVPDTLFVKRYYAVSAIGGNNYQASMSLRYDTAETHISIENLALFRDSSGVLTNLGNSDFLDSDLVAVSLDSITKFSLWYLGRYDYLSHHPYQFLDSLIVNDNGATKDTLVFGAQRGATDGIDATLGEVELGAKPANGTFDVRWSIPPTRGTQVDIRDLLTALNQQRTYTFTIQPGPGGYPFTIRWNTNSLAAGTFFMQDSATQGNQFSVNMKIQNSTIVTSSSIKTIQIVHTIPMYFPFVAGWNLISLPLYPTSDGRKIHVFPTAVSEGFGYSNAYYVVDTMKYGVGYWLKFSTPQTIGIEGVPLTRDTIPVVNGWNMIGMISSTIAKSSVTQIPPGIILGNFFEYKGSYQVSDSLRPSKGYWIKISGSGALVFASTPGNTPSTLPLTTSGVTQYNTITVSDRTSAQQTLYFGSDAKSVDLRQYELPPPPPAGSFDTRFASGSMVETCSSTTSVLRIRVQSSAYPVSIRWHVAEPGIRSLVWSDASTGRIIHSSPSASDGNFSIADPSITSVNLSTTVDAITPKEFSLKQNYPNPFNPTTRIEFTIPQQATVTIKIFSVLGQEVAHLADNQPFSAGAYALTFDGTNLGSGLYFYQFVARSTDGKAFIQVKKMLLTK
jgi:photosystem II stability/assembly factor-like uncharacterized protein